MGKRVIRAASVMAMALSMAACASSDSRPRVISSSGVNSHIETLAKRHDSSSVRLFYQTALAAYPSDYTSEGDPAIQRLFLNRGFKLIKDRCRIYLSGKADRQRGVNVWRDLFAPITALSTGVIGIIDNGDSIDNDVLAGLGLVTGAATAGFEIYEERYLFGAQNVDAVSELIEKALDVDADQKLKYFDGQNALSAGKPRDLSYTSSVDFLVDNQMICSPHRILRLVNKAIKAGEIVPAKQPKPEEGDTPQPEMIPLLDASGNPVLDDNGEQVMVEREETQAEQRPSGIDVI